MIRTVPEAEGDPQDFAPERDCIQPGRQGRTGEGRSWTLFSNRNLPAPSPREARAGRAGERGCLKGFKATPLPRPLLHPMEEREPDMNSATGRAGA
jgi:hypothetical protein